MHDKEVAMAENNQYLEEDDRENARSGVILREYKRQMAWRRSKVKELLARGYSQHDIGNTLHISQPTISRDIHYVQKEIRKGQKIMESISLKCTEATC
jgi:DNA-binding NarL/FixJ family response regulator